MTIGITDLYREEARRQAIIALEIVEGALATSSLIPEVAPDRGVDRRSLTRLRDTLEQEIYKLERNEATIAVIGPMKSGKSTSINAIVGSEIVPSRDKPMTTFPTIISHRAGLTTPVLTFELAPAFEILAGEIAAVLEEGGEAVLTDLRTKSGADDLIPLAKKLRDEPVSLPLKVSGHEEIRALLIEVNDLSRLARALGVSRAAVDEALTFRTIPRIEIEFEHLANLGSAATGTLSFIDTPGPDEAADSLRLEAISREQLERASAIILIANHIIDGGEASQKVQDLLGVLPEGAHERLYVFANRYDQREQRVDGSDVAASFTHEKARAEGVKEALSSQVFDRFGPDVATDGSARVFPVSSRQALLANQARRAIRLSGELPRTPWSTQFFMDVASIYGRNWQQPPELREQKGAREGADALWKESRFAEPLDRVIETAAKNASLILVLSCLDKLKGGEMARLFELLDFKVGAFGAETDRLRTLVSNLSSDLLLLQGIEREARARIRTLSTEADAALRQHFTRALDAVEQLIEAYMETGNPESAETRAETVRKGIFGSIGNWLGFSKTRQFEKMQRANESYRAALGKSSSIHSAPDLSDHLSGRSRARIPTSSEHDAKIKSAAIFDAFQAELNHAADALLQWTTVALETTSMEAKAGVDDSFSQGWSSVQEHVAEILNVTVNAPDIEISLGTAAIFDEAVRARGHATQSSSRIVTYDRPGVGAAVQRFFGGMFDKGDWGRSTRTEYSVNYYIEIGAIRDEIKKQSDELRGSLFASVSAYMTALDGSLKKYSGEVNGKIEQFHRHICEERTNREGDADRYNELRTQVSALAGQASDLRTEASVLRAGVH